MIQNISTAAVRPSASADPFKAFEAEFGAPLRMDGLAEGESAPNFADLVTQALHEVDATKAEADNLAFDFATGKPVDVHTLMIQVAKADTAMQITSAISSKVATGLNSLLQTQI